MRLAGDLDFVVKIVDGVKNRVLVIDVDNRAIGEHAVHRFLKHAPFGGSVKIVGHEKSAVQTVVAELGGLRIGDAPFAYLHGVEPGPVEHFIAIVEVDDLLDGAYMHTRQAANRQGKKPVGGGEILAPEGYSGVPVGVAAGVAVVPSWRIHHAGEGEFGLLLKIGRQRIGEVFDARVLLERLLKGTQCRDEQETEGESHGHLPEEYHRTAVHYPLC